MTDIAEIILTVKDTEFTFRVSHDHASKYINTTTQGSKIAPAHNLLMSTVAQEQKAALKPYLVNSIHTMTLASALLEEYAPDLGVAAKKLSTTPND